MAALRADAGYVTIAVPRECLAAVEVLALEPVKRGFDWDDAEETIMAEAERADAVALGPGLGRSAEALALVARLLERLEVPRRRRRRCAVPPRARARASTRPC